jgi:DNA-binding MarR family transcriptional regulator
MADTIKVTENGAIALTFLQSAERPMTGSEIAEATGLNSTGVHGVLNALVKNGLVAKGEPVTQSVVNRKGLTEERSYVTYFVTELGSEYVAE